MAVLEYRSRPVPEERLATRAPAKINLTLNVLGRRADGYHLLESLVAFAGAGDALELVPSGDLGLTMSGPQSAAIADHDNNLVLTAARHLMALKPGLRAGHFHLTKRLPVASGIGGGSSDAAAALRLLARLNKLPPDDPAIIAAARETGADVPVCLGAKARVMSGIGDVLGPPLALPRLFAVLVNPGFRVATADVFAALGLAKGSAAQVFATAPIPAFQDAKSLLHWLGSGRNDLEAPAMATAPVIGEVLAELRAVPGCRLARMSGSGATCFGIFDDCDAAARAARGLGAAHKNGWVKPTVLR